MDSFLSVQIKSPEKTIWEGKAEWISSKNAQGPFDILPFHANFISVIENNPIKIKTGGKIIEYKYDYSVVYAHSNKVSIFVNI